jgi:hypothetical protein
MWKGIDYFNCLDSEIQEEYIYEFNNYISPDFKTIDDIMEVEFGSLNSFIISSFRLMSTKNGTQYWINLIDEYGLIIQRDLKLKELGI